MTGEITSHIKQPTPIKKRQKRRNVNQPRKSIGDLLNQIPTESACQVFPCRHVALHEWTSCCQCRVWLEWSYWHRQEARISTSTGDDGHGQNGAVFCWIVCLVVTLNRCDEWVCTQATSMKWVCWVVSGCYELALSVQNFWGSWNYK